jgi:hypothetical protein
MQDSPVVQSASPAQYYARVLVVYRIPADTTLTKAQFVGSFLPDGTGLNDNVNSYNSSAN